MSDEVFRVPLIIRGEIIQSDEVEYGGRRGGAVFRAPELSKHIGKLSLRTPSKMADLYQLKMEDILDYLEQLGSRLNLATNPHLQDAMRLACRTSGMSESILTYHYAHMGALFQRSEVLRMIERSCGLAALEGWVDLGDSLFPGLTSRTRAFGARCVHVIAGNSVMVAVLTIIRNAFTRSDGIVKLPSNDPLTAAAIVRTMVEMAPDHPITRHISVAYWKGGDAAVEEQIYDPRGVEKLIAWGGFDSVKHITKYLQPGIDLITQDPKLSGTIIGKEAFANETTLLHVARRLALDIGAQNQEACVSARIIYVESGTDRAGLARANHLGELTFAALQALPGHLSTPHHSFDGNLKSELDAIRFNDEYKVYGGRSNEGAVIVSQEEYPVDFSRYLSCRVGNIVPVDDLEAAVRSVNAYTQTIGIFPEELKLTLRDRLAYQGAQRLVALGGASTVAHNMEIQDAIESVRRMCKWVVDERLDGAVLEGLALHVPGEAA